MQIIIPCEDENEASSHLTLGPLENDNFVTIKFQKADSEDVITAIVLLDDIASACAAFLKRRKSRLECESLMNK